MNTRRDDQTRAARTELPAHSGATRDRAVAALSRAQTSDALHYPRATVRDPELVEIHAEADRFYQACLAGSWVPGYLASRALDAACSQRLRGGSVTPLRTGRLSPLTCAAWAIATQHCCAPAWSSTARTGSGTTSMTGL